MQRLNRILKNDDFSNIIQTGDRVRTEYFSIFFLKSALSHYRIGITVSKKISKLAVVRNKIKRRIVAIINSDFDKKVVLDMIIIPNKKILDLTYDEIKKQLIKTFTKLYRLI